MPVIVAGTRRILQVIDRPSPGGSAGIGIDATESEAMRADLARTTEAHRRTLDQLSTAVAIFRADQRMTFYNAAFRQLWGLEAAFLDSEPTDSAVLDRLRTARKLPEQADFRKWKAELHEAYRAIEPRQHEWYLPDGRTLRVVTTPNPEGGVTYLLDDVTERIKLVRRYEALIGVQGETLEALNEGVAVFGSDGRLDLHNPAFARLWRLDSSNLNGSESGRASAHRGDDGLVRAALRRRAVLDAAARRGHLAGGARADPRAARTHRRQRARLHHGAVAGRRNARDLPGRDQLGERRARADRARRRACRTPTGSRTSSCSTSPTSCARRSPTSSDSRICCSIR